MFLLLYTYVISSFFISFLFLTFCPSRSHACALGPSSDFLDPVPILCQRCLGRIPYDTKEARGGGRTKEQHGTGPTVVAAAVVLALYLVSFSTNQWSGQESRAEFETSRGSGPSWDKGEKG